MATDLYSALYNSIPLSVVPGDPVVINKMKHFRLSMSKMDRCDASYFYFELLIIHFSLLSTLFGPCHLNPNFIFCYFRLFWKHHLISININPVIPRVSTLSHKNIKVGSDGLFLSDMLPVVHYLPHPNCSLCFIPTYIRFLWLFVKYWNEYASETHKDVPHTPVATAGLFLLGEKLIKPNETVHIKWLDPCEQLSQFW